MVNKVSEQLSLPVSEAVDSRLLKLPYRERLIKLLLSDLDFHDKGSGYASHNFHAFPAKFPPQLPRKFIDGLTQPEDVVLDPMMGSGTTILEAFLRQRQGVGFDIDPLALLIAEVKVTSLDLEVMDKYFHQVIQGARERLNSHLPDLNASLASRWDNETKKFIDYWFTRQTQLELLALVTEIEKIPEKKVRQFLQLVFSSSIITKTGGVSLALDLAHTRPHKAKLIIDQSGRAIVEDGDAASRKNANILTKTLRSAIVEFEKKYKNNLKGVSPFSEKALTPKIAYGNAQALDYPDSSVDLIVTSPPYASNAIDYMRAHKFSLVWFGYPIADLSQKRQQYIGGDAISGFDLEDLPHEAKQIVRQISSLDKKKSQALLRYYSEMTRALIEMYRVLKPGKASVVVVGSSVMRGMDTQTHTCLASIGRKIGFDVPAIGVRTLDRNRRMLPASTDVNLKSQIQQRMHQEFVIGFYKP